MGQAKARTFRGGYRGGRGDGHSGVLVDVDAHSDELIVLARRRVHGGADALVQGGRRAPVLPMHRARPVPGTAVAHWGHCGECRHARHYGRAPGDAVCPLMCGHAMMRVYPTVYCYVTVRECRYARCAPCPSSSLCGTVPYINEVLCVHDCHDCPLLSSLLGTSRRA